MSRDHPHRLGINITVGDHDTLAIVGFNNGGAGFNALYRALMTINGNLIVNIKGLAQQDQQTRQPIL